MKKTKNYLIITILFFLISCTEKQESFTFVQLCDTQLGFGGYEHDVESFKVAVKLINKLNPDFVVICGDLVNNKSDSSYADFKAIVENLQMPCYNAPGNHDVGNIANDSTLSYYRKTIGKDYYKFQNKGYSFIVVNTQLWKTNVQNESEKFNIWFREALEKESINNNPVFVVGHYPLYEDSLKEEESYHNLPLPKRKEILDLFKQNNVVAYLTGHLHKTKINNVENIQLVSGGTTSKNLDNTPLGFRVWEVSSDSITHHFVPLQKTLSEQNEKEISNTENYAPQTVDNDLANKIKYFLINDYLKDDIAIMKKSDRKFQFYKIDLNGDGKDEVFIRFFSPYFCGTGGCTFLLIDQNEKIITKFTVTRPPIFVEKIKVNGWNILLVRDQGVFKELKFENGTYPTNPSMVPKALYDAPSGHAEIMFDENFSKAKTYEF